MYLKGIVNIGLPIGITITNPRGAYKRGFEGRKVDVYQYLEAHSGEYNDEEKKMINDPYADGWAWRTSGQRLKDYEPSRWLSAKNKAETAGLFKMGFKDAGELT